MTDLTPGRRLYNVVRGCFTARGQSLNGWLRSEGIRRHEATTAIFDMSGDPKYAELRTRILVGCGLITNAGDPVAPEPPASTKEELR